MPVSALLCAAAVAAIHFYIFYLELLAYGAGNFRGVFRSLPFTTSRLPCPNPRFVTVPS